VRQRCARFRGGRIPPSRVLRSPYARASAARIAPAGRRIGHEAHRAWATQGEGARIRGSEAVRGWTLVQGQLWKAAVPNSLLGKFSPYVDRVCGD